MPGRCGAWKSSRAYACDEYAERGNSVMASYVALLRKGKKSDYSVSFPDFPGCITAGKTLDEAYRLAAEARAFHIEGWKRTAIQSPPRGRSSRSLPTASIAVLA